MLADVAAGSQRVWLVGSAGPLSWTTRSAKGGTVSVVVAYGPTFSAVSFRGATSLPAGPLCETASLAQWVGSKRGVPIRLCVPLKLDASSQRSRIGVGPVVPALRRGLFHTCLNPGPALIGESQCPGSSVISASCGHRAAVG
jgi:hypothetical protein